MKPSESVEAKIYVKALALEDADGNRAVLATTDFAGIWGFFTDAVYEAIASESGLARERFLFTCAHNHSSPSIGLNSEPREDVPQEQVEATVGRKRD
ncbi:MAG: hypothetical protein HY000_11365 [Planctomycetes bacterium]|nr:hypothetical protein [Planctomycetota bacterium]